jgi:hypothetical protein
MSNTYTWGIAYMDTKPSDDGLTDVVISCQWACSATTGGEAPTTAYSYGYANFSPPSTQDFTAYSDLTQNQVLGWVWASGVDQASVEAGLDSQIEQKLNPPSVILPSPWVTASA